MAFGGYDMIDKKVRNKKDCSGCHACSNICPQSCITMEADEEGFLYATVNYSLCTNCTKCIKVCPIINKKELDNNPVAYSCINNDEKIRIDSSSGGVFTLIAENIISKGGVVFGAEFNHEYKVEHCFVELKKSLCRLRGSKYVQSSIGNMYKQAKVFLDNGREVLFSGTPCQIEGLLCFLGKPYSNLFTIDVICHGVPSPKVWHKYIEFREKEARSRALKISFRRKDEGWKRYSVSFLFKNNTEYRQPYYKDLYMAAFLKNICLRPSCYECVFKTLHRKSDITIADFWGIQNLLPEMDDDKGTSLVFVNSESGQLMFKELEGHILHKEVDMYKAICYNSSAIRSAGYNPKRDMFFRKLDIVPFNQLVQDLVKNDIN